MERKNLLLLQFLNETSLVDISTCAKEAFKHEASCDRIEGKFINFNKYSDTQTSQGEQEGNVPISKSHTRMAELFSILE